MFYGHNAEEIIRDAFHVEPEGDIAKLPGVVSRKKQLIPRCWPRCRRGSDRLTAASRRSYFLCDQKKVTKKSRCCDEVRGCEHGATVERSETG